MDAGVNADIGSWSLESVMSERNKESLSALMDGEADELEVRRILNQLDKDDELYDSWKNYHLMGSVMRDEYFDRIDLTQGINQTLDGVDAENYGDNQNSNVVGMTEEIVPGVQDKASKKAVPSWYNPLTSVAVAATVTLAVLVGVQNLEPNADLNTVAASNTAVQGELSASRTSLNEFSRQEQQIASQSSPQEGTTEEQQKSLENAQQQLQNYILENTSVLDSNESNVSPFARVVEFEKSSK